jgi:hypothetical protein
MRSLPRSLTLLWTLLVGLALAMPSSPSNPTPSPSPSPTPSPTRPTFENYRRQLESNSYADVYYEVYRCTRLSLGQYTNVLARAVTDSSPHKSRYMAHNVQLRINGRLINRSRDIEVTVSGASETNFITSIPTATFQTAMSCPEAFLATFLAQGWHKGISLYGHNHSFHSSKVFYG